MISEYERETNLENEGHRKMRVVLLLVVMCVSTVSVRASEEPSSKTRDKHVQEHELEVGLVNWGRSLDKAYDQSTSTGKPVLVLFQEVPGCSGCKKFGRTVLSHPLIVEGIESEFTPVLVYNNREGKDTEILRQFKEPAWNYQVIRFLNSHGKDIIPRRDKVWDVAGVAGRMGEALGKANRKVPAYLTSLTVTKESKDLDEIVLSMACFWIGEMKLGKIDGVMLTEAGFLDGREVTRVWYDPDVIDVESLVKRAAQEHCARSVYCRDIKKLEQVKGIDGLKLSVKPFDGKRLQEGPGAGSEETDPGHALQEGRGDGAPVDEDERSDSYGQGEGVELSERAPVGSTGREANDGGRERNTGKDRSDGELVFLPGGSAR